MFLSSAHVLCCLLCFDVRMLPSCLMLLFCFVVIDFLYCCLTPCRLFSALNLVPFVVKVVFGFVSWLFVWFVMVFVVWYYLWI